MKILSSPIPMAALCDERPRTLEEVSQVRLRPRVASVAQYIPVHFHTKSQGCLRVGGFRSSNSETQRTFLPARIRPHLRRLYREARVQDIGAVCVPQAGQVLPEPPGTEKTQGRTPWSAQTVLEGEEESGQLSYMIGVEVREKNVSDLVPSTTEAGQAPKRSSPTVQEK